MMLAEILRTVDRLVGCGDNSCMFKKPSGMATNGGCRCRDRPGVMRALAQLYKAAAALANLAAVEQERDEARNQLATVQRERDGAMGAAYMFNEERDAAREQLADAERHIKWLEGRAERLIHQRDLAEQERDEARAERDAVQRKLAVARLPDEARARIAMAKDPTP